MNKIVYVKNGNHKVDSYLLNYDEEKIAKLREEIINDNGKGLLYTQDAFCMFNYNNNGNIVEIVSNEKLDNTKNEGYSRYCYYMYMEPDLANICYELINNDVLLMQGNIIKRLYTFVPYSKKEAEYLDKIKSELLFEKLGLEFNVTVDLKTDTKKTYLMTLLELLKRKKQEKELYVIPKVFYDELEKFVAYTSLEETDSNEKNIIRKKMINRLPSKDIIR